MIDGDGHRNMGVADLSLGELDSPVLRSGAADHVLGSSFASCLVRGEAAPPTAPASRSERPANRSSQACVVIEDGRGSAQSCAREEGCSTAWTMDAPCRPVALSAPI